MKILKIDLEKSTGFEGKNSVRTHEKRKKIQSRIFSIREMHHHLDDTARHDIAISMQQCSATCVCSNKGAIELESEQKETERGDYQIDVFFDLAPYLLAINRPRN